MDGTIDDLFRRYEAGRLTRRQVVQGLLLLLATTPAVAQTAPRLKGTHIDHLAIRVANLARSQAFYAELFGATPRTSGTGTMGVEFGPSSRLTFALNPERAGTVDHVAVAVDSLSLEQAVTAARQLKPDANFHVEADGVTYFNDPDGLRLQLSASPRA